MTWEKIHSHYAEQDWIQKPSIFLEQTIQYFEPKGGYILEIGAGLGQDSRYFHELGYKVLSTDFSVDVLGKNKERSQSHMVTGTYQIMELDVSKPLPFEENTFDGIYAHLSLHYFSKEQTNAILCEIQGVIKRGGIFATLLNTKTDPEYGKGESIEEDFFLFGSIKKRFYSRESAKVQFSPYFETILVDDLGETYKDSTKGIHNLIRFVGKKN